MNTQVNLSSETLDKVPLTQYSEDAGSPEHEEELPPYSPSPAQSLGVNITKVQPLTKKNVPNGGRVLNDPPMDSIHLAIFTMICCCWPCGLVGLLHGIKGLQAHYHGDSQAASIANKKAKRWAVRSIIAGVILLMVLCVNGLVRGIIYGVLAANDDEDKMDMINATVATTAY